MSTMDPFERYVRGLSRDEKDTRIAELERENARLRSSVQSKDSRLAQAGRDTDRLLYVLSRYRNETPIEHQPHMIAHLAEEMFAAIRARRMMDKKPGGALVSPAEPNSGNQSP